MATTSRFAAHCMRLGLSKPPATRAELTAAYRREALKHHPDRGGCGSAFAELTDSYNALLTVCAPAAATSYYPASLRSHGPHAGSAHDTRRNWRPLRGIATVVVLPSVIGMVVGMRLLYTRPDTDHLRAGGTSRFVPDRIAQASAETPQPAPAAAPAPASSR